MHILVNFKEKIVVLIGHLLICPDTLKCRLLQMVIYIKSGELAIICPVSDLVADASFIVILGVD